MQMSPERSADTHQQLNGGRRPFAIVAVATLNLTLLGAAGLATAPAIILDRLAAGLDVLGSCCRNATS